MHRRLFLLSLLSGCVSQPRLRSRPRSDSSTNRRQKPKFDEQSDRQPEPKFDEQSDRQPESQPQLPTTVLGMIYGGLSFPGANIIYSELHPTLLWMATRHATYQAQHCTQGHQLWDQRTQELSSLMGNFEFKEIAAESWPWQASDHPVQLGYEMFKCWKYSSGHWSVASKQHRYYGIDMCQGRNGIWYACAISAD